ncbi:hypothetical protein D9619_007536 [Psilocybe cf. subviscida]|uniref:DUF5648 domain-containing protein n=1 Tax=Psilocybe cf. subviscida TaxID=2480587 RepID=A0A8H5B1Y1_9AGAR|nr:hypothetical protein D9619_007536 [Psilocybe cf. subviscida]
MIASSNFLMILVLPALLAITSLATPVLERDILPAVHSIPDTSTRSASTCADPSLAKTFFQAYDGLDTAHVMNQRYFLVNTDSVQSSGPPLLTLQSAVFKGWPTQQPFTLPLFRLATANNNDIIFLLGADAQTPPIVSGFGPTGTTIIAWVYNTSVCDSVPLMSAVLAKQTDHYYTTDPDEHAGLLSLGWTDGGIVAFVLPPM